MKDKLEPNMYVRLVNDVEDIVVINKIANVFETTILTENDGSIYQGEYTKENVVKASYNIIDLIEEKDLLEIEYFSLRYEKRVTRLFEVTYKEGRFINLDNAKCQFMLIDNDWTDNDKELEPIIKSIVTKEQFSSMEYRLGDDK